MGSQMVQAQKVKIKDDIATVDGADYLKWVKKNGANEAYVYVPNSDEELIFIRYKNYSDPSKVSKSNPEGKVRWVEVKFLTLDLVCEVDTRTHKALVKLIYENNLFENGKMTENNVWNFVAKYGTDYSDNRPTEVIIVNE